MPGNKNNLEFNLNFQLDDGRNASVKYVPKRNPWGVTIYYDLIIGNKSVNNGTMHLAERNDNYIIQKIKNKIESKGW